MKLTADTITDEQIGEVWRLGCADGIHGNPDVMRVAAVARNGWRGYTSIEQQEARARCAAILNDRSVK
jgi:hypothetical protein